MRKSRILLTFAIAAINIVFSLSQLAAAEIRVIKDPKPTHVETDKLHKKLIKIGEIPEDFSDEHFLARPVSYTVDDEGNIYVFDNKILKIFKFNQKCEFEKTFSNEGQGPCEIAGLLSGGKRSLYYGDNGKLYFFDKLKRKALVFSKEGKCLDEIRFHIPMTRFSPVIDASGNIYTFAPIESPHLIDLFDKNLNKIHSFLTKDDVKEFILKKPEKPSIAPGFEIIPGLNDIVFDIISSGKFIIYLVNPSRIFIFEKNKLKKSFYTRPKLALKNYQRVLASNPGKQTHILFGTHFLVDKDDSRFFYLSFIARENPLYRFDIDGRLTHILYAEKENKRESIEFFAKRNGFFYGVNQAGIIKIFKESK